jgi:hypothetical protein
VSWPISRYYPGLETGYLFHKRRECYRYANLLVASNEMVMNGEYTGTGKETCLFHGTTPGLA